MRLAIVSAVVCTLAARLATHELLDDVPAGRCGV
jgi:hypothetical protein